MSCYHRPRLPGVPIYFTVCLAEPGSSLLLEELARLRQAVRITRAERPFQILAWVVLPDHLHCVWRLPDGDTDYSTRWGAIKARFTRSLRDACRVGFHPTNAKRLGQGVGWNPTLHRSASKQAKGDAGIWQRRFWEHHLRSEADVAAAIRYCWMNPVKHRLVARPEDWLHSSVHRDMRAGQFASTGMVTPPLQGVKQTLTRSVTTG